MRSHTCGCTYMSKVPMLSPSRGVMGHSSGLGSGEEGGTGAWNSHGPQSRALRAPLLPHLTPSNNELHFFFKCRKQRKRKKKICLTVSQCLWGTVWPFPFYLWLRLLHATPWHHHMNPNLPCTDSSHPKDHHAASPERQAALAERHRGSGPWRCGWNPGLPWALT